VLIAPVQPLDELRDRTDLIAAEADSSKRATFFLSMTVPKAVGTTGTFVNIEAIR